MKYIYPYLNTTLLLIYLFFTNQLAANAAQAVPDNTIDISVDKPIICVGETITIFLASSESGVEYQLKANGIASGAPINGTGSQISYTLVPTATTTYSVTATNTGTSETSDLTKTVTVTVNPGPNLDLLLVVDKSQICENSNEPILVSIENSTNGLTYWLKDEFGGEHGTTLGTGGKATFSSVSPNTSTTFFVETTAAGCSGSLLIKNDIRVDVISLPYTDIQLNISEPEICVGEKTFISLDTSEIGVNYQLFDGTYLEGDPISGTGSSISFPEFSPFRSVNYQVIATNEVCGTQQNLDETIRVDVGLQPEIHLHPTIDKHTICEGEQVVVSLTPTDTRVQYQLWDGNTSIGVPLTGNNEEISFEPTTPSSSTTYRIEALGERCLAPVDIRYTVDVDVHHSPETDRLVVSNKDTVCAGEEVVILVENSQADILYKLYDGTNFIEPSVVGNGGTIQFPEQYPNATNTYSVCAHETVCTDPVDLDNTLLITVPDISTNSVENFATPEDFCEGEAIDIELTNTISGIQYILQDGDNIISELIGDGGPIVFEDIVPDINSNLYVSIGNCNEKLVAATPNYTLQSNPKLQIVTTDVHTGYDGNLVISVLDGVAPYTYVVSPGETITSDDSVLELNGLESGTYQVLVVDGNACRSSDAGQLIEIELNEDQRIIVNNALTPNGDGINDDWKIHYDASLGYPEVYVFNIYGQEVFHSKSYQNDWKGSYNGSILPNGAYYYLIEFESEEIKPVKGSLSILGN